MSKTLTYLLSLAKKNNQELLYLLEKNSYSISKDKNKLFLNENTMSAEFYYLKKKADFEINGMGCEGPMPFIWGDAIIGEPD